MGASNTKGWELQVALIKMERDKNKMSNPITGWLPWAKTPKPLRWRRLRTSLVVGIGTVVAMLLALGAGLFASAQERAADYLYATHGAPGDEIAIVAIDEKSQQALGEWPWTLDRYVQLLERIDGASAIGFDILLTDAGLQDDRYAAALIDAVRQNGNVVVPWAALELVSPASPKELYAAGRHVETFPALADAAVAVGAVNQGLDRDGIVRRVPLLIDEGRAEPRQSFGLRIVNAYLDLERAPVSFEPGRITVGSADEIAYQIPTAASGTMLINYLGATNTFSTLCDLAAFHARACSRPPPPIKPVPADVRRATSPAPSRLPRRRSRGQSRPRPGRPSVG